MNDARAEFFIKSVGDHVLTLENFFGSFPCSGWIRWTVMHWGFRDRSVMHSSVMHWRSMGKGALHCSARDNGGMHCSSMHWSSL